jgi:Ca2+-binding EF-hand superfamily protein
LDAFKAIDLDNNGILTKMELQKFMDNHENYFDMKSADEYL